MSVWKKSVVIRAVSVSALVVASASGGYLFAQKAGVPAAQVPVTAVAAVTESPAPAGRAGVALDFADIAVQQGPAVVHVRVTGKVQTAWPGLQNIPPAQGTGSGFIVDPSGVVLTNAHVVRGAAGVTVKLADLREFAARVVGIDTLSDVAVLRIAAKDLPTVKIGDPHQSKVGEWVVAIGSPFGLDNTVTAGIVSAKSRTLADDAYVPFLQTDVPVNPGNSGGPLFNLQGEVIGINSQIYTRSGGYQGLSFAIPIDVAMKVEKQLIAYGKVTRGRMGVAVQEVSSDLAATLGLDRPKGALIQGVERGSPADKAGIQPGDVVLAFNGSEVSRSTDLSPLVSDAKPGTRVNVTVWRNGKLQELTVRVGELV